MRLRPALIVALLWGSAAAAQTPAVQTPAAQMPPVQAPAPPNTVASVAVTAGQPPTVVATYPTKDAKVAPGVLVLKVTFDQAMQAGHSGFGKTAGQPDCLDTPRLLGDGKTFVLLCTLLPGKSYEMALNDGPDRGFASAGDRRAVRYDLPFSTSSAEPVRSLKDAMKAAGLSDLDMPVPTGLPKAGS